MLNYRENYLDATQQRLLFYALQIASLHVRAPERDTFIPRVMVVDGLHLLPERALRIKVLEAFRAAIDENEYAATLVVTCQDHEELKPEDFVLTILEQEDLPPAAQLREQNGKLVLGGQHGQLWKHTDKPKRDRYREYLRKVSDSR